MRYLIILAMVWPLWAVTNLEVAERADGVIAGFGSSKALVRMTLKNADGQQSVRELSMWTLEGDAGDKSLIEFHKPADVRGTKLLSHEVLDGKDSQWIYMPALKRVKRIAGNARSGAFVGSEFSYEDLTSFDYRKFTYAGDAEESDLDGIACYEGERVPTDADSAYARQRVWVEKTTMLVRRVDYYDRTGALMKSAVFSDYRRIGDVWRVGSIHMVNRISKKETRLEWLEDAVNAGLGDAAFEPRGLKR